MTQLREQIGTCARTSYCAALQIWSWEWKLEDALSQIENLLTDCFFPDTNCTHFDLRIRGFEVARTHYDLRIYRLFFSACGSKDASTNSQT